jgi:hypothetical protein
MGQMKRLLILIPLLNCLASTIDLSGRWSSERAKIFTFQIDGNGFSGRIEGPVGDPNCKIVDGTIRGHRIFFFILHDAMDDAEVIKNGGKPFRDTAEASVEGDAMEITGARELTGAWPYKMVLMRVQSP